MRKYLIISVLLMGPFFLMGQSDVHSRVADPGARPREHSTDILKMKVELNFEPAKSLVKGNVTHTFKPLRKALDTLFFDGPGLSIKECLLDGKNKKFSISKEGLTVFFNPPLSWDKTYDLRITYEAVPKKGLYFIGWNVPNISDPKNQTRKQIWTQGQGVDNRYWIPMFDNMNDKFMTETVVTFDKDYKVLSNGDLKSVKENKDGTKTWNYAMAKPHAGYLLMLAIDKYEIKKTKTKNGTPVAFWYYPESPEKVEPTSKHTEKIIEFFEEETGYPYPWGTYSQVMVQDFMYGAMENTSATIFGDFFNVDEKGYKDRNYVGVNAHELAHQWFGDLITARSGADVWLQESFATYYSKIFMRTVEGEDRYKWNQRSEVNAALAASEKNFNPVRKSGSETSRVYQKGSTVLQMLRYYLGDDEYKKVINYYLKKHEFGNVETNDLYQAIQDVLGISADWFFEQWVYRGGEPWYSVSWLKTQKGVEILVEQTHETDPLKGTFKMPVNLLVHYKDGSQSTKKVWVENVFHRFLIETPSGKEPDFVLFDVNSEITKKLIFPKSLDELRAQAQFSENMIDRYDAISALKDFPLSDKKAFLMDRYLKEKFFGIKNEIISQLKSDKEAEEFFLSFYPSDETEVKKQLLKTFSPRPENLVLFESALTESSYQIIESGLEKLCTLYPQNTQKYLNQTKDVLGQNHNVRIKWLEINCRTAMDNGPYFKELVALSSPLYEFRTRISAMEVLKSFNYFEHDFLLNLLDAGMNNNSRLAAPALMALGYLVQTNPGKEKLEKALQNDKWTDTQKADLKKLKETVFKNRI